MRRTRVLVGFVALLLTASYGEVHAQGPSGVSADTFYKDVDKLYRAKADPKTILDALNHAGVDVIDYRFFYFRGLAYYRLGLMQAGDAEATLALRLAQDLPKAERDRLQADFDNAKPAPALIAGILKCTKFEWTGVQAGNRAAAGSQ